VQDLVEGVTLSAGQHRDLGGIERKGDR